MASRDESRSPFRLRSILGCGAHAHGMAHTTPHATFFFLGRECHTTGMQSTALLVLALCVIVLAYHRARRARSLPRSGPPLAYAPGAPTGLIDMHRIDLRSLGGEVLVVRTRTLAHGDVLFQLDTGYAGPPVLSTSYIALLRRRTPETLADAEAVRRHLSRAMGASAPRDSHDLLAAYVRDEQCASYTSGCNMHLMGIGRTEEQQSGMYMCPPMAFATHGTDGFASPRAHTKTAADVLVNNHLANGVHILTSDYLFQVAPCCIHMATARIEHYMQDVDALDGVAWTPLRLVGGAVVIPVTVGTLTVQVTVDTGASGGLCVGSDAVGRIACDAAPPVSIRQEGVHGESICSSVVTATANVLGVSVPNVAVFINDRPVEHTDGYAGMGFLRALDLVFTTTHFGCRPSGLRALAAAAYSSTGGSCPGHPTRVCKR